MSPDEDPERRIGVVGLVATGSVSHQGPFAVFRAARRMHRLVATTRVARVLYERPAEWTITLGGLRRRR